MSFIQTDFLIFFPVVFALYWLLRAHRLQNAFLVVASFVFYGWMSPWMTVLLFGVTGMNYAAARGIVRWPDRRDAILGGVVALSMANLAVFKYFSWFAEDIVPHFVSPERASMIAAWHLVLPLGLSFYTFHNLAYTIDVYRGRFEVRTDPVDYFLYGAYFPQLVAGPVERAANVLPQLEKPRRFDGTQVMSGLGLALWGAFKKVALADTIAPYVDLVFQSEHASSAMIWAGALGFTIQALADFSGYTDIARGTSRMLGIELMDNFAHPYLAASPMEFWQRWHISFSTWLRDYVYLPACFSDWVKKWVTIPGTGEWGVFAHTSRALFITMMVSGLWHGSTANFLLWGFYYFLIGTAYAWALTRLPKKWKKDARWRWLTVPVMFALTVFGMHIFREPSVQSLVDHLLLPPLAGTHEQWVVTAAMLGLCAFAATPLIVALLTERLRARAALAPWYPALRTTFWAVLVVAVYASVRTSSADFIYFQF
jgi:D-alanyl-lipoteichoic acid acyltransferase DltB (MBOAT superfamily)